MNFQVTALTALTAQSNQTFAETETWEVSLPGATSGGSWQDTMHVMTRPSAFGSCFNVTRSAKSRIKSYFSTLAACYSTCCILITCLYFADCAVCRNLTPYKLHKLRGMYSGHWFNQSNLTILYRCEILWALLLKVPVFFWHVLHYSFPAHSGRLGQTKSTQQKSARGSTCV